MGSGVLAIVVIAVVLVAGPTTSPAYAVTLYPGSAGSVAAAQLPADQRVMTARLRAIGYPNATVKVAKGALVVTNGPKELADPQRTSNDVLQPEVRRAYRDCGRHGRRILRAQYPDRPWTVGVRDDDSGTGCCVAGRIRLAADS